MGNLSIELLTSYLKNNYKGASDESLFMKLVEEVGETAEALNIRAGRKSSENTSTDDLANELVDIIHYAVAIAAINDINLENAIIEKDKRASIKYNHPINLEQFMTQQKNK